MKKMILSIALLGMSTLGWADSKEAAVDRLEHAGAVGSRYDDLQGLDVIAHVQRPRRTVAKQGNLTVHLDKFGGAAVVCHGRVRYLGAENPRHRRY